MPDSIPPGSQPSEFEAPRTIPVREFTSLTPSGFHSAARDRARRRPKHDEMQRDFLTFLRGKSVTIVGEVVTRAVEGEYPIIRHGQIIAFADCAEFVDVGMTRTVCLYEIKPVIDTTFGIVRQAKALLELAHKFIPAAIHTVHVVVPHDDPLLMDLRREWPRTWAWGVKFEPGEDA